MRVIVDTNVFVSAVYFGGIPGQILDFWRDGQVELVLTAEILAEYEDVVRRLRKRYPGIDPDPIVSLAIRRGRFVQPLVIGEPVCVDRDDDKFLAAALGGGGKIIVSGDNHLLAVTGYRGIQVLTPADFVKGYRSERVGRTDG